MQATKFLGVVNRIDAGKMKYTLPTMILAQPAGFYADRIRFALTKGADKSLAAHPAKKNFLQLRQALGKIREQLGRDLAFIPARTQYARHHNPSWILAAQSSRIS